MVDSPLAVSGDLRAIATRYDGTDNSFAAGTDLVAADTAAT